MRLRFSRLFWLPVCAFVCATGLSRPSRADDQSARTARVQHVVDELKSRLDIPQTVTVRIVEDNPLMASVGRDLADPSAFAVSFEADFVDQLSDDALAAAVAHELGHVWIFTHFPFLQTEQLANEIAMRVVSRDSLVPLYAQVDKVRGEPHREH